MKKFITFLLIYTFTFTITGQNGNEAKDLLDAVAKKVESYTNIYVEFTHKFENKEAEVNQEARGFATLQGNLYHLNYMGTEQLYDGNKTYLIIHEDEEVIIQDPDLSDDETLTPSKMFSFYKTGFNYEMGELKNVNGIKIQFVKLIPIDSNSEIINVLVGVDVKTNHIYTIIETGQNETVTTFEVRTFKTNQPVSEKLFIFDEQKYRDEKKYTISEPN